MDKPTRDALRADLMTKGAAMLHPDQLLALLDLADEFDAANETALRIWTEDDADVFALTVYEGNRKVFERVERPPYAAVVAERDSLLSSRDRLREVARAVLRAHAAWERAANAKEAAGCAHEMGHYLRALDAALHGDASKPDDQARG